MLIYEKNNKLNLNFDPSKSIEDNPDIVIGENEISVSGNNIVDGGSSGGIKLYGPYVVTLAEEAIINLNNQTHCQLPSNDNYQIYEDFGDFRDCDISSIIGEDRIYMILSSYIITSPSKYSSQNYRIDGVEAFIGDNDLPHALIKPVSSELHFSPYEIQISFYSPIELPAVTS